MSRISRRMLLSDRRITSAAQGKSLLAGDTDAEAFAGDIQRVVVVAVPVVRRLARGARRTRVPWVMVASSAISVGIAVSTGVRELRTLASLVAHVRTGGAKRLAVERFDGEPVTESDVMPLLVDAGFLVGPRRAVLRP